MPSRSGGARRDADSRQLLVRYVPAHACAARGAAGRGAAATPSTAPGGAPRCASPGASHRPPRRRPQRRIAAGRARAGAADLLSFTTRRRRRRRCANSTAQSLAALLDARAPDERFRDRADRRAPRDAAAAAGRRRQRSSAWPSPRSRSPTANMAARAHAMISPLSIADVLTILTPVLMWLWASIVGWLLVQRLLLRPLGRTQGAVSAYRPGDQALSLATRAGPAERDRRLGGPSNDGTRRSPVMRPTWRRPRPPDPSWSARCITG